MGKSKDRGIFASVFCELFVELPKVGMQQITGAKPKKKKPNSGKTVHVREVHHHHHHHHTWHRLEVHPDFELQVVKKRK